MQSSTYLRDPQGYSVSVVTKIGGLMSPKGPEFQGTAGGYKIPRTPIFMLFVA